MLAFRNRCMWNERERERERERDFKEDTDQSIYEGLAANHLLPKTSPNFALLEIVKFNSRRSPRTLPLAWYSSEPRNEGSRSIEADADMMANALRLGAVIRGESRHSNNLTDVINNSKRTHAAVLRLAEQRLQWSAKQFAWGPLIVTLSTAFGTTASKEVELPSLLAELNSSNAFAKVLLLSTGSVVRHATTHCRPPRL